MNILDTFQFLLLRNPWILFLPGASLSVSTLKKEFIWGARLHRLSLQGLWKWCVILTGVQVLFIFFSTHSDQHYKLGGVRWSINVYNTNNKQCLPLSFPNYCHTQPSHTESRVYLHQLWVLLLHYPKIFTEKVSDFIMSLSSRSPVLQQRAWSSQNN